MQIGCVASKSTFLSWKVCTKFLKLKLSGNIVVRNSLAYLTVQNWVVVNVLFYLKFWPKLTYLLKKHRFLIDMRS